MFDSGPELFDAVCRHGVEGVVGKGLDEAYLPGERAWLKVKNRNYWRLPYEIEAIQRSRERSSRASASSPIASCTAAMRPYKLAIA
jgi:ATP-dependent DNA ligase